MPRLAPAPTQTSLSLQGHKPNLRYSSHRQRGQLINFLSRIRLYQALRTIISNITRAHLFISSLEAPRIIFLYLKGQFRGSRRRCWLITQIRVRIKLLGLQLQWTAIKISGQDHIKLQMSLMIEVSQRRRIKRRKPLLVSARGTYSMK